MKLLILLVGACTSPATITVKDTAQDTGSVADTGTAIPPAPCALDGAWVLAEYTCDDEELLELEAGPLQNCRLPLVATRHDPRVSLQPPLCFASEVVVFEPAGSGWVARSEEQSENLDGCYGPSIVPLDLGAVGTLGPMLDSLEVTFERAPWSLEACGEVALSFVR